MDDEGDEADPPESVDMKSWTCGMWRRLTDILAAVLGTVYYKAELSYGLSTYVISNGLKAQP